MFLLACLGVSDFVRNVQIANKLRIPARGNVFTNTCEGLLKRHFSRVISERTITRAGRTTEVDIAVADSKTLYLFECKYSVPPCTLQELRDIWGDIRKGVSQQNLAVEILSDPGTRYAYLAGWFPGMSRKESDDMIIKTCVISSHRLFSGLQLENVPIRDYPSFMSILTEHVMSHGVMTPGVESTIVRFSTTEKGKFSPADLDNYLGDESRYLHMFQQKMCPVTELNLLIPDHLVLATDSYVYNDLGENHVAFMEKLGFLRLPDEKKTIDLPMSENDLRSSINASRNQ
jgi:hypothetical protein